MVMVVLPPPSLAGEIPLEGRVRQLRLAAEPGGRELVGHELVLQHARRGRLAAGAGQLELIWRGRIAADLAGNIALGDSLVPLADGIACAGSIALGHLVA